jgi:hypothetical protein
VAAQDVPLPQFVAPVCAFAVGAQRTTAAASATAVTSLVSFIAAASQ